VGYLQEPLAQLPGRLLAVRALQTLRSTLFAAPGREAEMQLLWREALATACFARMVARHAGFDVPLLTGAGLLHRAGEIAALRALALAEQQCAQRVAGSVMDEIQAASDDGLVSRVTRSWMLPGQLRLTIIHWREQQDSLSRPESVALLMMAQALATELVHASTCPPGLVEVATESLRLPWAMVECARADAVLVQALLACC
jgi:HD-like signal output (HDOD) protein